MIRSEYKMNDATIRIHDDYVKSQVEARKLIEKSYKLALAELCTNMVEGKETNQNLFPLKGKNFREES